MALVLLVGRPGSGKTTAARRTLERLVERGVSVRGFTTAEIRGQGGRLGFEVESVAGDRAVLAHVRLPGPPRVGKYGVDIASFERVAIPSLKDPRPGDAVVIDELGKMELASERFRAAVDEVLASEADVVATVHAHRHPYTDALVRSPEAVVRRVDARSRAALVDEVVGVLGRNA